MAKVLRTFYCSGIDLPIREDGETHPTVASGDGAALKGRRFGSSSEEGLEGCLSEGGGENGRK